MTATDVTLLDAMSDELRTVLREAGGLVTAADLSRRWGFTHTHVVNLTRRVDFPGPVLRAGRVLVYLGGECEAWYDHYYPTRPRPPREDQADK